MEDQATVTYLSLSMAAFAVLWFYVRRLTKVDEYRERLFTLRDELFDYMWGNDLPFDDPAYLKLREYLNQGIRLAETFTLPIFLTVVGGLILARRLPTSVPRPVPDDPHLQYFRRVENRSAEAVLILLGPGVRTLKLITKMEGIARRSRKQVHSMFRLVSLILDSYALREKHTSVGERFAR